METNVNVYQVEVHVSLYQESTNSLSGGWEEKTKLGILRKEHNSTLPFHSIPSWTWKQKHQPNTDPQERTRTHWSSSLLCRVRCKPCHVVYNRGEIGWPIESDLWKDLAIGVHYALDPWNTRKASCHESPTTSPVIIAYALLNSTAKVTNSTNSTATFTHLWTPKGQISSRITANMQSTGQKPEVICREGICRFLLHSTFLTLCFVLLIS